MIKITKKYIFECKLKGEPIHVHVNKISEDEIQLLFKHKILLPWAPFHLKNRGIAIANYPIANGRHATLTLCKPGDTVQLRWR